LIAAARWCGHANSPALAVGKRQIRNEAVADADHDGVLLAVGHARHDVELLALDRGLGIVEFCRCDAWRALIRASTPARRRRSRPAPPIFLG
jgi:hypothetical protein